MSQLHETITDDEYHAVVRRMRPIILIKVGYDPETQSDIMDFNGETADEWFDRNVANFGIDQAVQWFKDKAKRQLDEESKS